MLSRVLRRSYHISGKFTHTEAITNFIIKSIENTDYNSAIYTLKKHSKSLSLSNIHTIDLTLKTQTTRKFVNLYSYVLFGQAMCYITDNYAVFPMIIGSYPYILECVDHFKIENIVKSMEFVKQLENVENEDNDIKK
jgi:hypothetical protein